MDRVSSRRILKQRAKKAVKKHYWIYLVICLVAGILGAECTNALDLFQQKNLNFLDDTTTEEAVVVDEKSETEESEIEAVEEPEEDDYDDTLANLINLDNTNFLGGISMSDSRAEQALAEILKGNIAAGNQISDQIMQENVDNTQGTEALGRSRGVLAQIVNHISSGKYLVTLLTGFYSISQSRNLTMVFFILGSLSLVFLFWFFLQNMYIVISRRFFLEGRVYEKIPLSRVLLLLKAGKWAKVSWVMFVTAVYLFFWSLTLVGGVIKGYAYSLVPYLIAENPDMSARQAITLSRKMMKGHKWERFVMQLSFLWWSLLGLITMGLSDLFYVNSYRIATYTEYFYDLRQIAKDHELEGTELLNDRYLYEKAGQDTLSHSYADIMQKLSAPQVPYELKGIRGFIAKNFGITFFRRKEEAEYEKYETEKVKLREYTNIINGLEYPKRLFTIPEKEKRSRMDMLYYMRHYSIWSLILMFFTFAILGWVWEVALHFITNGEFVNRGVLHGPWLPIYGIGGILMLTLLTRFRNRPLLEFFTAVLLSGCVEYFMGVYLELTHHGLRWWDYSGYFLNLNGRICAEGLLCFGLGGIAIVYIIAPLLDNLYRRLHLSIVVPVCVGLVLFYIGDQIYSAECPNTGTGVTTVELPMEKLSDIS